YVLRREPWSASGHFSPRKGKEVAIGGGAHVLNTGDGWLCKLLAASPRPKRSWPVKLTTKGRYAVMAMADLARHSSGNPVALAEIAERQEISLSYLEQLFAKLRRGNLVKSVRGPGDRKSTRLNSSHVKISYA